jgi:DNA repair exonuclease SbcCD ATPase subunit
MITTLISETSRFTHILHFGDCHIRLTKRHEEYREIFNRLFEEVKNSPPATLICILGDVVHNKTDLSPECVQLVKDLLFNLAELRPTILIPGNHDTNLTNRNRLDSLTPIVNAINHSNLYYLKESGLYGFGNVCINNYSIFDSPEKYIKGEDIPQIYRNKYQHFICLFHGPVDNAITDIGFRIINKSVTTSLFNNHHIALLGDIHKNQTLQEYDYQNNKPVVRFCGSLIQQNHGESLNGHGYTLWNLDNKSYEHIEIPNNYGFFTVVMDKGQVLTDLATVPKKARIQFQLFETVATEVKTALTELRGLTEVIETSFSKLESDASKVKSIAPNGIVLGNISNRDYQVQLITDYLKNRLNITDQAFIDQVIAVNDKTNGAIKKDDFARNIRWIPIRFEWDNMFSYGEGNVIDFTKMKDVVGLFAANASGKSTILSALTFCLFDKCEREFKAANILNVQKTSFRCKLEFEIDGKKYFIERNGKADRKGAVKVNVRFWKLENDVEVDLHGEDRRDTNEVIRDYLGTYEDFILTSLSVQGGKNNGSVIDMGNTDRKDLLAQFMGLSIFDRLYNEANERFKELATLLKTYRNDDYTKLLVDLNNAVAQANNAFTDESVKVQELTTQQTTVQQKIVKETKLLIKIDGNIPPLEVSQANKIKFETVIKSGQTDVTTVETELVATQSQLTPIETEIKEMEEKDISSSYKGHQALLTTRVEIQSKIHQKKNEIIHRNGVVARKKGHKYDPNCTFCVSNAGNIITNADKAESELKADKVIAEDLIRQLTEINVKISANEWAVKSYDNYTQLLSKRNKVKDAVIRLNDKINRLKVTLKSNEEGLIKIENDIATYNKNKDSWIANEEVNKRIQAIKLELSNVETLLKVKNKTLMDLNGKIATFKSQIDTINKKMEEAKKTEAEYKVYETYTQAVCRDGIPFNVITMTVPEIEREVNTILSQISEFSAKFETDGKNIIPYIVYDDKKWLMSLTSGMEKFTLSLAIRVALINISNLPRPNFLVIDEGFSVLDAENLSSMSILFTYLKSQFDFVLIISHLEALRDCVDNQLEVIKEDGFSKVNYI